MAELDFNKIKGFICDMDGVIYHGNKVLPGVAEFINWMNQEKKEYLFLTNNSGYTPCELKLKLARMGLDVPEHHFYTSALATAAFLKEQSPGCSVYAIGEAGLLNALYEAGCTMNDVNPDYVVVGEGRTYSLESLTITAVLAILARVEDTLPALEPAGADVDGLLEELPPEEAVVPDVLLDGLPEVFPVLAGFVVFGFSGSTTIGVYLIASFRPYFTST